MIKLTCDKCGKETKIDNIDILNNINIISRKCNGELKFDLCDECMEKIIKFLNTKNNKE